MIRGKLPLMAQLAGTATSDMITTPLFSFVAA
jgi:hypothetical protein